MDTLGDALPRETARVRDKLIPLYQECGPAGAFALAMVQSDLDKAARAMAEGDLPAMITAYQSLREYKE